MTRKADWQRVRLHRSYTVDELARSLSVCKATIRRWVENGLPVVCDRKPMLIAGADVRNFLCSRQRPKSKCRIDECYCFKCRRPRAPAFGEVEIASDNGKTANLRALCAHCANLIHKRVSIAQLSAIRNVLTVSEKQGP